MTKSFLHIGTSGWYYPHWNDVFYPEKLKTQDRLHFYAGQFNTVEINTTFYHLPKVSTVKNWDKQVYKDFLFSIKASRYITHMKRLKEGKKTLKLFYQRIKYLDGHIGPILFQLPPSFQADFERLKEFISHLDPKYRYVFEFRHLTWYTDEIFELLHRHKIALCLSDLGGKLWPIEITTNFTYVRLHGPQNSYKGSYSKKQINEWKKRILKFKEDKVHTYCYFDNDEKGYAIQDAFVLKKLF